MASKKKLGRPADPAKSARIRICLKMNPKLVKKLKLAAVNADTNVSDLLEEMLLRELAA